MTDKDKQRVELKRQESGILGLRYSKSGVLQYRAIFRHVPIGGNSFNERVSEEWVDVPTDRTP